MGAWPKQLNRILILFICSLGGGLCAAFAYALSADGQLNVRTLTLPAVAQVAAIGGVVSGILISPIVIWALRDKMLRMAIPVTYALSAIVMVTLNMLQLRFSMYIGFALTIAVIGLYKALGK